MNTPLRDEIAELIWRTKPGAINATKAAEEILNLLASKMPEKNNHVMRDGSPNYYAEGWNAYHDSVKSILKGGTDE
jgi:hypothetical protein